MIERFALSMLLAAALTAPAAAGEAAKPSGAEEALKFEISFEKDKLIEKCAGGGVGAKCGSATFQLGKKDAKKKCVEFGELKHSQVDKLDEEFVKEIAAEKKIAEKAQGKGYKSLKCPAKPEPPED